MAKATAFATRGQKVVIAQLVRLYWRPPERSIGEVSRVEVKATEFIKKRYLHMKSDEAAIWTKFLRQTELEFDRIIYDLHLGKGQPIVPGEPPYITALKRAVTRKRVDAVGMNDEAVWIFEVKPRVGMSALGQLLSYYELYAKEYPTDRYVFLAAIGERKEPDIDDIFALHAINIFLV